tara:strand:+ start:51809 stop:52924 length:1116 start_codon:yes stop_codon:yes gene_type:complete
VGNNFLTTDIVIIGGGIIGLTAAHKLLQLGAKVSILERGYSGSEASWAGGGILFPLLPWNYPNSVTQLTQFSNQLLPGLTETLKKETGIDPEYQASGMLVFPDINNQEAQFSGAKEWCACNAFSFKEVYINEFFPLLKSDKYAGKPVLWLPSVAQVRSPRLLQALKRSVRSSGGFIMENTQLKGWRVNKSRVESVITDKGDYVGANYIVAAGAWSQEILNKYALKINIYPVKGQMLLFKVEPGLLDKIVLQGDFYLIPRKDGHILAGSSMEDTEFDKSVTIDIRKKLLERAHKFMPMLTEKTLVGHWAGLRPGTSENIPIISCHPNLDNLYLNSGHHRYGVTMASGSAQLLSNMIMNNSQPFDVAPYQWPV